MLLYKDSIISDNNNMIMLNTFSLNEVNVLKNKIIENMLDDLSKITGLDKKEILEDYIRLNEYSPIKEILKKESKYTEEKSLVLIMCDK